MIKLLASDNLTNSILMVLLVFAGAQVASHTAILIGTLGFMVVNLPNHSADYNHTRMRKVLYYAEAALHGPAALALIQAIGCYTFGFAAMLLFSIG